MSYGHKVWNKKCKPVTSCNNPLGWETCSVVMGIVDYYNKYSPRLTELGDTFSKLTNTNFSIVCGLEHTEAFDAIKMKLPVHPFWSIEVKNIYSFESLSDAEDIYFIYHNTSYQRCTLSIKNYDPSKFLTFEMGANLKGLGAVLIQESHPIHFTSYSPQWHKKACIAIELEFLAVAWVMEKLHHFLFDKRFHLKQAKSHLKMCLPSVWHKPPQESSVN